MINRVLLPLTLGLLFLFFSTQVFAGEFKDSQNETYTNLDGVISHTPAQHMIGSVPGKEPYYLDLPDGSQMVIHAPKEFDCLERTHVTGRTFAVTGGGKGQKSEEEFTESQLDVVSWSCYDNKEMEDLLNQLVSPDQSRDAKAMVEQKIIAMGKAAIPSLIQHLNDARVCWTERILKNEAQLMNRPANIPAPKEEWGERPVSIGMVTNRMLLQIITPQYQSPYQKNFKPFSTGEDGWMFRVQDWRAWWKSAQYRSLDQIHEEMKKTIDAYWKSHGTEQLVR